VPTSILLGGPILKALTRLLRGKVPTPWERFRSNGLCERFRVSVRNDGTTTAGQVFFFEGLEALAANPACDLPEICEVNAFGDWVLCRIGDIPPQETRVVDVAMRPATTSGVMCNTAYVMGSNFSGLTASETACSERNLDTSILTKVAVRGHYVALPRGREVSAVNLPDLFPFLPVDADFHYKLTIQNPSIVLMTDAILTDELPESVRFVSLRVEQNGSVLEDLCLLEDGAITCDLGNLQPGDIYHLYINVSGLQSGGHCNRAILTSGARTYEASACFRGNFCGDQVVQVDEACDGSPAASCATGVCGRSCACEPEVCSATIQCRAGTIYAYVCTNFRDTQSNPPGMLRRFCYLGPVCTVDSNPNDDAYLLPVD